MYHFVLVCSLYRIVTQPRLPWWPQVDIVYTRTHDLRAMFTETLNKVTQISHQTKSNQVGDGASVIFYSKSLTNTNLFQSNLFSFAAKSYRFMYR